MTRLIAFMPTPRGLTGGPRRLLTLGLAARSNKVDIIIASEGGSDLLNSAESLGISTIVVNAVGVLGLREGALLRSGIRLRAIALFDLLRHNYRFARAIKMHNVDAVWIRGSKGFAFGGLGALSSGLPIIWDVDGEPRTGGVSGFLLYASLRLARGIVVQYVGAIEKIFGGRVNARRLRKIHVLVPGVDLESLQTYKDERSRARRDDGVFRIIQVGSICINKNQLFTVEVLSRIPALQKVEVYFVGGTLEEGCLTRLKNKIRESRLDAKFIFNGWRNDVHSVMADADLLVMPSMDEGVPNTVQEAMAIGVPVVVSDAGGMPEIVSHSETGWVLPLDDPEAWARQIDACRGDPAMCRAVGEAAGVYAAEHFGTENWGREYAKVIHGIVGDKRKRATS